MSKDTVTLTYNEGSQAEYPVLKATLGNNVFDIRKLGQTQLFSFDPGFLSTASCESKITFIDGGQGLLYYRGYPLEELAEKSDYLEVSYLLLHGELPTKEQKQKFVERISSHREIPNPLPEIFKGFKKDAHPMAMLLAAVSGLSAFYEHNKDLTSNDYQLTVAYDLISKIPTLCAMCYRHNEDLPFISPQPDLGYAENFLNMVFAKEGEKYVHNPILSQALDRIFLLHADHEQNASTSTVRLTGSSGTNPLAAIAAGIASLWGPAHGGANEAVLKMLHEIGDVSNVDDFIKGVKEKKYRLMGFGHRVYKNMDPRAKIMKKTCDEVLKELGLHDSPLFKLAVALEDIALHDDYFISHKLYPNVDFYSGIVLSALGIPTSMFTVIFALARSVGWISHWYEMVNDKDNKIGRPRQLYTGYTRRDYIPLDKR